MILFYFSLRTSDSNYLNESYSFYQAIQTRFYYTKANKEEKYDKKRFILLYPFLKLLVLIKKKQLKARFNG